MTLTSSANSTQARSPRLRPAVWSSTVFRLSGRKYDTGTEEQLLLLVVPPSLVVTAAVAVAAAATAAAVAGVAAGVAAAVAAAAAAAAAATDGSEKGVRLAQQNDESWPIHSCGSTAIKG